MHRVTFALALRTITAIASLAACAGCAERAHPGGPRVGEPFPEVVLAGLESGQTSSWGTYRGRTLIINFWATWCEPCRSEMPSLERLSRMADARRVAVLGVSVDSDLNLAREFILQNRLTFPNFSDPEMRAARTLLGIQVFPATFLVLPDGRLAARVTGARDWTSPEALRELETTLGLELTASAVRAHP